MTKQLKDKAITVALLQNICRVSGDEALFAVLDGWALRDLVRLVRKVDAHSGHANSTFGENELRRHVVDLAVGWAAPTERSEVVSKPLPVKRKSERVPSKFGAVLGSKVHSGAPKPSRSK